MKGLASFRFCVLFELPNEQTALCYRCFYKSFGLGGWLAKELRTIHKEEGLNLVDFLSNSHGSDDGSGSEIGVIITILCGRPELPRKTKTMTMLRLSYLCVGHFPSPLPVVLFYPAVSSSEGPNLAKIIEPVQSYIMFCNSESNFSANLETINCCVELLETFAGTAILSGHDAWSYVDFHQKEKNERSLMSGYRKIRSASGADDANLVSSAPEILCSQNPIPSQPPGIDVAKVHSSLQ